ncbi:MAG: transcription antitermination factor NusB [Pseudomonadota bacterium]
MKPSPKGGSRSLSREFALRAIYAQLLSGQDEADVAAHVREDPDFAKANTAYFEALFHGVLTESADLELKLAPHLDRPIRELSPIERGILLIGAFELADCPDVPYRVALNEAVELAKKYGGTDGHKYVNGVLDKLAKLMRPDEAGARN